jgi:hypothetical protein
MLQIKYGGTYVLTVMVVVRRRISSGQCFFAWIIIITIGSTALCGPWPFSEDSASHRPAVASSFFVTFFQGGVVIHTPNPQLSCETNVFCQGCLPQLVGPNLVRNSLFSLA